MQNKTTYVYTSLIGGDFLNPIVSLFDTLTSEPFNQPNEVQSSIREHSYSASIICLVTFAIESIAQRAQYLTYKTKGTDPKHSIIDYIHEITATDVRYQVICDELFAVRNAIAHGHIWESEIVFAEDGLKHATSPQLVASGSKPRWFGNSTFDNVVDPTTRKTKSLNMNAVITSLTRHDVVLAFRVCLTMLTYFQNIDPNIVSLNRLLVFHNGKPMYFSDFVDSIVGNS